MKLSELTTKHNIICRSEQEWERIAKLLDEDGRKWQSGDAYWPLLYKWGGSPMAYRLDGTYWSNVADIEDLVIESTNIEDEEDTVGTLKEDFFFKVGDKCWSPTYGHGEVVQLGQSLKVKFGNLFGFTWTWHYQPDGREHPESPQPTLFHQEVTDWPCPERLVDLPKLNVDDKVYVESSGVWKASHFSHWVEDNRIYMAVFVDGRSSHTALGGTHLYARWKIAD